MRVKRYIVDTMPEAMAQIRSDLGTDAVILSTKDIKVGGFLGMFSRKKIEVIAAVEQEEKSKSSVKAKPKPPAAVPKAAVPKAYQRAAEIANPTAADLSKAPVPEAVKPKDGAQEADYVRFAEIMSQAAAAGEAQEVREDSPPPIQTGTASAEAAYPSPKAAAAAQGKLHDPPVEPLSSRLGISESEQRVLEELKEMKEWIAKLSRHNLEARQLPEPLESIRDRLLRQDVSARLSEQWLEVAEEALRESGMQLGSEQLQAIMREQAKAFIDERIGGGIQPDTRIVYIAGPTGVGKTTTIAKIAAEQLFRYHRKVGFITSDTYRISAVEQLRTYASILNVPMEVVQSPGDMQRALQTLQDCDLILMDTAGRNYRNELLVSELQSLFSHSEHSETYLVLSLTSKSGDMIEIADHFSKYALDKVIFTKMDETGSFGPIFNLLHAHNLRLSYMTNGQNVPDDLLLANSEQLCDLLLGDTRS
ncbi:flagellar biosynthesis protein FlhF [Paenibacillus sp. FSL K6-1566]|uniref:flagellar biosynthesis protein FlhF n=1 Tax=Paenibacillus sp. FSL K6-1566 TaxID=2954515 RepID=UPI003100E614